MAPGASGTCRRVDRSPSPPSDESHKSGEGLRRRGVIMQWVSTSKPAQRLKEEECARSSLLLVVCGSFAAIATPGALANNPHNEEDPTGKPEFSCQEINPTKGSLNPFAPGHAQESPGSPFNERAKALLKLATAGRTTAKIRGTTWPATSTSSTRRAEAALAQTDGPRPLARPVRAVPRRGRRRADARGARGRASFPTSVGQIVTLAARRTNGGGDERCSRVEPVGGPDVAARR